MPKERVGLVSSSSPFVAGGYRFIVDWLEVKLRERDIEVETIYIPTVEQPELVLEQMAAFRMIELDRYFDRVITFRPPSHMIQHRKKVCWFIHHIRVFYDLWEKTEFHGIENTSQSRALRSAIHQADTIALGQAYRLFTNSKVVSSRLKQFNGLSSEVLYPPVADPQLFRRGDYGDEIVCICRMELHKRQHLLIEAMRHTMTPVRLRLCGLAGNPQYHGKLMELVSQYRLEGRVVIDHRWITEEEKADLLSRCLAAAYVPFDEDSYGYPTLEAAHAERGTLTLSDSGGVAEFIVDGATGLIAAPNPQALAQAFDRLFDHRSETIGMGESARRRVAELGIDWDTVIDRLMS